MAGARCSRAAGGGGVSPCFGIPLLCKGSGHGSPRSLSLAFCREGGWSNLDPIKSAWNEVGGKLKAPSPGVRAGFVGLRWADAARGPARPPARPAWEPGPWEGGWRPGGSELGW